MNTTKQPTEIDASPINTSMSPLLWAQIAPYQFPLIIKAMEYDVFIRSRPLADKCSV